MSVEGAIERAVLLKLTWGGEQLSAYWLLILVKTYTSKTDMVQFSVPPYAKESSAVF